MVNSSGLSESEKSRISKKLATKLTKDGTLILQCDESRSQHKNKDLVLSRFFTVLEKALIVKKKRKASKPSKSAIEKRLKAKKVRAEKKANRSKPVF